jgi:hypothetical protein
MAIKVSPQLAEESSQSNGRSDFKRRSLYSVRQDNSAPQRARITSGQAYRIEKVARAQQISKKSDRSKKHSTSRQTEPATTWLKKPISEEVNRMAAHDGFTRSREVAELVEWAVHQKLHQQHAAMIGPIIRDVLIKEREKDRRRMGQLLVQNTVLTRELLYLVTNLITRIGSTRPPTAEQLHKILDWAKDKARENTFKHGEETEALINAVGVWLDWEQGRGERAEGGNSG